MKRGRKHLDIDSHHPSKKCRLTPLDTHDMEWLKGEISDVKREVSGVKREISGVKREISDMKESIMGIGDYLKEELGFMLAEVVYLLREPQDT